MKLRLSRYTVPTLVLGLSSLFIFMVPSMAQAIAPPSTCTWTGGGSDSNFSTAANWSGCNSAAPVANAGDSLIFDSTNLIAYTYINNDITNLSLGSITFQGSNSNYYNYTITGNAITLSSGIVVGSSDSPKFDAGLTLTASQSFTGGGGIFLGDATSTPTLNVGTYTLTIGSGSDTTSLLNGYGAIAGSGSLVVQSGSTLSLDGASSGWTGSITAEGTASIWGQAGGFGSHSSVTILSGAFICLGGFNGADFSANLTIGGTDAIYTADSCGHGGPPAYDTTASVNFTGTVTLTADTTIYTVGTVTVSGPLNGNFTLGLDSGEVGNLVIDSSNNQSGTGNSTVTSAVQVTTVAAGDNQPSLQVGVAANQEYVIDGVRGDTEVYSGGLLKGTGTVEGLSVDLGGTVAPGHSPGCLTVNGGGLLEAGTYQAELDGTTACTGYDQLVVTGSGSTINLTGGTLTVTVDSGFKITNGQTFEIINNQAGGAITGQLSYNGTALPEGSTFTVNGVVFKISYQGGGGNNVVLTVVSGAAAPNTGFGLADSNWSLMAGMTTLSALTLLILARRYNRLAYNK